MYLLREVSSGSRSRYWPLLESFPVRDAVVNSCNMQSQYIDMLQMDTW